MRLLRRLRGGRRRPREDLLAVVELVDIVFWPVALDFKREDVEALADGELAAAFINGAIRTSEQEEMAQLLRRKSRCGGRVRQLRARSAASPAWPTCSSARTSSTPSTARRRASRTPTGRCPRRRATSPEGELTLPAFDASVRTLDQVIDVDYYLPGCPPPAGPDRRRR